MDRTVEQILFACEQNAQGSRMPWRCDKFSQQTIPQIYKLSHIYVVKTI